MSGLREALVNGLTHYNFCYAEIHASEPSIAMPEEVELVADAVLRVLAEHGDTQQVRTEIRDVIERTTGEPIFPPTMDAVMAVVAPILARAEAEIKRLHAARLVLAVFGTPKDAPQPFSLCRDTKVVGLGVQWPGGAVTIKWTPPDRLATVTSTSLTDALAVADPDGTLGVVWLSEDLGTLAEAEERAMRAEADLAAARQQLDQVREHVDAALDFHAEHVARPGWIENSCVCVACKMARALDGHDLTEQGRRLASQREDLIAQGVDPAELDIPLAPAGHDETGGES